MLNFRSSLLVLIGLVSIAGCKPPPAQEPALIPFEVLDLGAEPRAPLRYTIEDGTETTSRVTWESAVRREVSAEDAVTGVERVEIGVRYGPSKRVDEGVRFPIKIFDAEIKSRAPADDPLFADFPAAVRSLEGVGGRVTVNDRGRLLGGRYNEETTDVPVRLLWVVENILSTLDMIPLPDEAVGAGARWTSRATVVSYGVRSAQEVVYELVERRDGKAIIDVTVRRIGDQQLIESSGRESLEVVSNRVDGSGRIELDLSALGSDSSLNVDLRSELVLVEGDERTVLNVDEQVEITIASKTTKPGTSPR